MMYKSIFVSLAVAVQVMSATATPYAKSYAVVVDQATYADPEWKMVADALVAKHDAELVRYDGDVTSALPALQKSVPKYTCFVAKPEAAGFDLIVAVHRMTRKYDEDPYGDTIWGVVTGYTPADALRVAKATQPSVVSDALLSAGMGPERWRTARYLSTAEKGVVGTKSEDGKMTKEQRKGNLTKFWTTAWNEMDPDAVISSAHASQRTLEMPFSRGNVVCKDGKLFGYIAKERMIREDGYSKEEKVEGPLIALKPPQKPKLYFAVGNCLIGDIPDKDCMALAMMGFGKANQMIGYAVTTWYGKGGWGTLSYWEQMAGVAPLNEAFYFNNVVIQKRLMDIHPELPTLEWKNGKRDLKQSKMRPAVTDLIGKSKLNYRSLGLAHDRDVVAFLGDPALEIRLDKDHTVPARVSVSLDENDGEYTATLHAHADIGKPGQDSTPAGVFFPSRLKNVKLTSGGGFAPIFADNFVLFTKIGPMKSGEKHQITFTGEEIK